MNEKADRQMPICFFGAENGTVEHRSLRSLFEFASKFDRMPQGGYDFA